MRPLAPQNPSIQSFFSPAKPGVPRVKDASASAEEHGDGFSQADVDAVLHPTIDENWLPKQEYDELDIGDLSPGPRCVTFRGRIANLYTLSASSKKPRAAKGCIKIIVKDDTGAVTVRLWYGNLEYELRLGQLVSIWTPHVSSGEHGNFASTKAPLFTSIFPERDRSCHLLVHKNSDNGEQCKKPLGLRRNEPLSGLMTLKNFTDGGYDVADCRLLVCVKSIGAKKRITPKNDKSPPNDCINVHVFDVSETTASLSLWGSLTASASTWRPSHTILLLTSPGWRIERSTYLSFTNNTLVDIDPALDDAGWLRNFAARLTRKEDINPLFPGKKQLNVDMAVGAIKQIRFTFAELDEFARSAPAEKFVGWISVLIAEINLSKMQLRGQLFCGMHCGLPFYGNKMMGKCKACSAQIAIRPNPRILGPVLDETGCSQAGKLYLSDQAWGNLLGMSNAQLEAASGETLRYMEQRMLYMRLHLGVAWWAEEEKVGRLWVWAVRS